MKIGDAYVELKADSAQLKTGFDRAESMTRKSVGRMQASLDSFAVFAGRWAKRAGLAAVAYGVYAVKAAADQEKADMRLAASMKNLGTYSKVAHADLKAFAAGIQEVTTIADDATQDLMSLGMTLGKLAGTGLKDATVAAIGLSRVMDVDVRTAMMLVSRAAVGQYQLFTRYGIVFDEVATKQEKWTELMRLGAEGMKIAESETATLAGKLTQLKNSFSDSAETLGFALIPQIEYLAENAPGWGESIAGMWEAEAQEIEKVVFWLYGVTEAEKAYHDQAVAAGLARQSILKQEALLRQRLIAQHRQEAMAASHLKELLADVAHETEKAGRSAEDQARLDVQKRYNDLLRKGSDLLKAGGAGGTMAEYSKGVQELTRAMSEWRAAQLAALEPEVPLDMPAWGDPEKFAAGVLRQAEQEAEAERQMWDARAAFDDELTQSRIDNLRAAGNEAEARNAEIMRGYEQQVQKINDIEDALKQAYGVTLPGELAAGLKKMREQAEGTRSAALEAAARKDFGYRAASLREIGLAAQGKLGGPGAAAGKGPEEETAENTKKTVTGVARLAQILEDRTFEARYR